MSHFAYAKHSYPLSNASQSSKKMIKSPLKTRKPKDSYSSHSFKRRRKRLKSLSAYSKKFKKMYKRTTFSRKYLNKILLPARINSWAKLCRICRLVSRTLSSDMSSCRGWIRIWLMNLAVHWMSWMLWSAPLSTLSPSSFPSLTFRNLSKRRLRS